MPITLITCQILDLWNRRKQKGSCNEIKTWTKASSTCAPIYCGDMHRQWTQVFAVICPVVVQHCSVYTVHVIRLWIHRICGMWKWFPDVGSCSLTLSGLCRIHEGKGETLMKVTNKCVLLNRGSLVLATTFFFRHLTSFCYLNWLHDVVCSLEYNHFAENQNECWDQRFWTCWSCLQYFMWCTNRPVLYLLTLNW